VSDKPIIFSAPMVWALLAGTKTQTRRILKPQPVKGARFAGVDRGLWMFTKGCFYGKIKPRGVVGDRLWVREAWSHTGTGVWTIANARMVGRGGVIYRADDDKPGARWFPSIHMPREFSRLTLTVTNVRVQRLAEITEEDAIAEGSQEPSLVPTIGACWSERDAFAKLWNAINGPGAWAANSWVTAYTFKVHRSNIDALELANAEPTP